MLANPIYIPLEEAARLEGKSYEAFKKTIYRNQDSFDIKKEPAENGGKPNVLIHISSLSLEAQRKRSEKHRSMIKAPPKCRVNLAELEAYVGTKRYRELISQAEEEAKAVQEYLRFDNLWGNKGDLMKQVADSYGISVSTLTRQIKDYRNGGTIALIRLPNKFLKKQFISRPTLHPELEEYVRAEYLQLNGPTPAKILDGMKIVCEFKQLPMPCKDTVYRYINDMREYEADLVCIGREGPEAYEKKFGFKAHRKDPELANQIWEGDHHRCDFFVEYNGKAVRPWVTVWLDVCTRTIRGFTMGIEANGRTITTAFRNGVLKKRLSEFSIKDSREIVLRTMARIGMVPEKVEELSGMELPIYGLPDELYIDNGEDYKAALKKGTKHQGWEYSREIRNFSEMLNIKVLFCTKYHPWAKGHCERFFWTFSDRFARYFPGYCGNDNKKRPYGLDEQELCQRGELLTLEEAYLVTEYCINMYHNNKHSALGMTPYQKVVEAPLARTEMPDERELDMCLMNVDKAHVSKTGINKFGTKARPRVYFCNELRPYIGRDIIVRWDPNRIGELLCFDPKRSGQYIGTATNGHALHFGASQDDVKVLKKLQAHDKKEIKARLKAQSKNTLENIIMERTLAGDRVLSGSTQHPETEIPMITSMAQAAIRRGRKPSVKNVEKVAVNQDRSLGTFEQYMINKGKEIK